ncbi:MAG TPA: family 2 glycosyl transferase [Cyanobacteria bacterium UBA8156]|jgi:glycosyltransferase involved in cell wall biosynthesis|nr:family 2 glycosyl transferase [Cyanobacteria bacterium UBA8156]
MAPTVWLCIPTYNGDRFLAEALTSAIAQTYRPYRILVSDDGSSDRTLVLVERYRSISPVPFTVMPGPRQGMVANWNFCLRQALAGGADYIKFLFQDDVLLPTCLAEMVGLAETDPQIGLVCSRRHLLGENLSPQWEWLRDLQKNWGAVPTVRAGRELFLHPAWLCPPDNQIGEPTAVLLRSTAVQTVGEFDPQFRQYVDLDYWWRVMLTHRMAWLDRPLVSFRVHAGQTTQRNQQADVIWAEIYRLWLKALFDPVYDGLPTAARQHLYGHVWGQGLREWARCWRGQRRSRFATLQVLAGAFLRRQPLAGVL